MTGLHLDRIARRFSSRRARRVAANAQDATPGADSVVTAKKTTYLFVQSFDAGTIAPKEGEPDTYTLTLQHGLGQTVYFADRPGRDVGALPTPQFLGGLGFEAANPPNAALVVETAPGQTEIAVVELFSPLFDPVTPGVTYDVKVLAEWEDSVEMGFTEAPADLAALPSTFGAAHLFIDDCPYKDIFCKPNTGEKKGMYLLMNNGPLCWDWGLGYCLPCWADDYARQCNEKYPGICQGTCTADTNCGLCWW